MSKLYPINVDVKPGDKKRLAELLKRAYKRIVGEIETATDFGVKNRKAILAQIDNVLEELGVDVQKFIDKELPGYYKKGADEAVKQLKNIGAPINVKSGFSQLHRDAIIALVDDTTQYYFESITGIKRSANRLLGSAVRDMVQEEIAHGAITGDALKKVRQNIKGVIQEQGLSAITDKRGSKWSMDRYSEMLFRTKVVEARNMGLCNRMVENGYDLVQVSAHAGSCPLCNPWQGKILSITGRTPGYETLQSARDAGLFHPYCEHAINTIIPSLSKQTRAYDSNTGKYGKAGSSTEAGIGSALNKSVIVPATKYDKEFKKEVEGVAKSGGWKYSHGPVKKLDRSVQKVINDYDGDVYGLRDANRSVIFINDPWDKKEFNKMVKTVESKFGNVERVKIGLNRTENYKNNMINVTAPSGHVTEIQVTTKEMWDAKVKLGGDKYYHDVRVKAGDWQKTEQKMIKLYKTADDKTRKRLGL